MLSTRSSSPTAGRLRARSVVIATGAEYRRLDVADAERCRGCGLYYGATVGIGTVRGVSTSSSWGGGTSAGQGAVHLAKNARNVGMSWSAARASPTRCQDI